MKDKSKKRVPKTAKATGKEDGEFSDDDSDNFSKHDDKHIVADSDDESVPSRKPGAENQRRIHMEIQKRSNKRSIALQRLVSKRQRKMTRDEDSSHRKTKSTEFSAANELKFLKPKTTIKVPEIYSETESEASDTDDDDSEKSEPKPEPIAITNDDLKRIIITRSLVQRLLDKPTFEKTFLNSFVRISIGLNNNEMIYRIAKVVELQQTSYEYNLGSQNTTYKMLLEHGSKKRDFTMEYISNSPTTQKEFDIWMLSCQRDEVRIPSLADIEQKEKEILETTNYIYTEADVERLVKNKKAKGKQYRNSAFKKVCLVLARDEAMSSNDVEKVDELSQKIKAIDQRPYYNEKPISSYPSVEPKVKPLKSCLKKTTKTYTQVSNELKLMGEDEKMKTAEKVEVYNPLKDTQSKFFSSHKFELPKDIKVLCDQMCENMVENGDIFKIKPW